MRRVVWLRTFWSIKRTPWFARLYKQTSGLDLPPLRLQWIQMRPPFSCIILSPYIIIVSYRIVTYIIILSASSTQGRIPRSLSRAHQSGPQWDIRNCQMIMNKQYLQPMIWGSVRYGSSLSPEWRIEYNLSIFQILPEDLLNIRDLHTCRWYFHQTTSSITQTRETLYLLRDKQKPWKWSTSLGGHCQLEC